MKIAICFWGLTRSLKFTIDSLKNNIFDQLDKNNIEYDKFLHTYYFEGKYNNKYSNEKNIKLDFDEYKLLNSDYFQIDNQDDVIKKIDFKKYEYNNTVHNNRTMLKNAILALYSLKKISNMIQETNIKYDYILFIRPDSKILNKFNTRWFLLSKKKKILSPRFGKSNGLNNRMFVGNYNQGIIFANALDYVEEYTENKVFISEKFTFWLVRKKMFPNEKHLIRFIDFKFQRIRANGEIAKLDRKL